MKKNTKKGFTLVELLVVIAILAILASVAVVGYTAFINKAEKSKAETELAQLESAVNANLMVNEDTVICDVTAPDVAGTHITKVYVDGDDAKIYVVKTTVTKSGDTFTKVAADAVLASSDVIELSGDFDGLLAEFTVSAT